MDSSILSVAQSFGLRCTKAKIYRDKFGYVCATAEGPIKIQRPGLRGRSAQAYNPQTFDDNPIIAGILFQHKAKEYLHKNDFIVDRFLISAQNVPYLKTEDGIYTACFAHSGPNVDFTQSAEFLDVVACVAKMHHAFLRADIGSAAPMPSPKTKIGEGAAKSLANLTSLKKKLLRAGKFSEFDMLFLRSYEKLAPHIIAFGDEGGTYICHNFLKEENIYRQGNKIALANFSEAAQMNHLYDLAYLVKRYIKAEPNDIIPLCKILEIYMLNCPDVTFDEKLFRRILLYPDKFIKVSNDYYSKKRSFAPNTYLSRMEECLRMGEALLSAIEN